MNYLYLLGGAAFCMLTASVIGLVGSTSASPYVAGGIVLLSMGLAVKNG